MIMPAVVTMIFQESNPLSDLTEGRLFRIRIVNQVKDNTYSRNAISPGDEGGVAFVSKDEYYADFSFNAVYVNGKAYPDHHEKGCAVVVYPTPARIPAVHRADAFETGAAAPSADNSGVLQNHDPFIVLEGPIVIPSLKTLN